MRTVIVLLAIIWLSGCVAKTGPIGPEKEFHDAAVSVKAKSYQDAVAAYKKIAADSPGSALAAEALFELALVHAHHDNPRRNYAQATHTFEEFLKSHPDNGRAAEAQTWILILKTVQELKKQNEHLSKSIVELKRSIEQLKRIDVRHEERRKGR